MRGLPKTRKLSTRTNSRVWTWPNRTKEVKVKDSKLKGPAEKQPTLTARSPKKRDKSDYDKPPKAVKVKRETNWRKR